MAIAFPELITVRDNCIANNLEGIDKSSTIDDILQRQGEHVVKLIAADLERLAVLNKFNSLEKVRGNFRLVTEEFEMGVVLTPTMKLRRNQAKVVYASLIEDIYRASSSLE